MSSYTRGLLIWTGAIGILLSSCSYSNHSSVPSPDSPPSANNSPATEAADSSQEVLNKGEDQERKLAIEPNGPPHRKLTAHDSNVNAATQPPAAIPTPTKQEDVSTTPVAEEASHSKGSSEAHEAAKKSTNSKLTTATKAKQKSAQEAEAARKTAATTNKQLSLAQLVRKYPAFIKLQGSSNSKQVALTFDDAPDLKYTAQVLDILKTYKVKATFFLLGNQAEKYPQLVKRMIDEGHVIGNHSYSHQLFTKLSDESFAAQVNQTEDVLSPMIGYAPKLIRPPYGEITESQLLWAKNNGYLVVNWNVDSLDWKQLKAEQVSANILKRVKSGAIILQHSGGGPKQDLSGTVKALPRIIEKLQDDGYELVPLTKLLDVAKSK
ncbi:polysaccharide deacetylase family protein [Paenibacillus sp. YYML68]|uniref:polysaccharide deacetylase family protein n=1 Tax=Paenibacillus sp. YYML68 TaxID=2909250 RepID=UPI0024903E5F|nr:polysaccharide deacetylase family protein [Paenibacillus sp. YYML68]